MNPDALEELYDTQAEPLFRYLCVLVRCEAEAKDRLQELFLKIARNPGCLKDVTEVRAYLFRLAHNLAVDAFRRRTRQHEKYERLGAEPLPIFAPATDPDLQIWRQSMATALADLP